MDAFLEALGSTVKQLVPAALIFAALAVILKRDKVLAALMAARREIGTNLGLMLFNAAATKVLSLELQAAENDSRNKTISSPRIVTLNRKAATINNTQQVTILTGVNATTGLPIYQTISAPLTLGVTPSVNPDNRISLELNIAKSTITNATTGSLDTNTVTTSVIVENGGTVVIGGFARESDIQTQDRVPFLGDLPYVGFLFKTTTKTQSRSELLVFITPRIVSDVLTQR